MSANFIDIVCDQHKQDHFVARYHGGKYAWSDATPATVRERRESALRLADESDPAMKEAMEGLQHLGAPSVVELEGTSVVSHLDVTSADWATRRTVYPNRCRRCTANVPLRLETLNLLLDGFAQLGRTRVTLRELNDAARRVRVRRNSAEF